MNKVFLTGRLVKDVELKQTNNGVSVANFTLAVRKNYKDPATGEYGTNFIYCTVWRKTAENLAQYQGKGDLIAVFGSLDTRSYQDSQTGQNREQLYVLVDEIEYLSQKKQQNNGQVQPQQVGGGYQQPAGGNMNMYGQAQPMQQAQGVGQMPQGQTVQQAPQMQAQQAQPVVFQPQAPAQQMPQQGSPFAGEGEQIQIDDKDLPF